MDRLNRNHSHLHTARRILAIFLPAAIAVLVWSVLVQPIVASIDEGAEQIETRRSLLARYLAVGGNEERVKAAHNRISKLSTGREIFKAKSRSIAAALLQSRLKSLAATNRLTVHSATPLPASHKKKARLIGVRVSLSGGLRQIHRTIHAIESNVPYMFIEAAQLRQQSRGRQTAGTPQIAMTAQLDVYGMFEAVPLN